MPYAPRYEPQTQAPQGSQVRLVAPNAQGGAAGGLAQGLQALGQGMGQMAIAQQFVQDRHDDIFARKLRQEFLKEVQPLAIEYSNTQGENAINGAPEMQKRINELREAYAERAGNSRMRDRFMVGTDEDVIRLDGSILTHAGKAQFQVDRDTTVSEIENDTNEFAASWDQPALQEKAREKLIVSAEHLSNLFGQTGPAREETLRKVLSQAHSQTIKAMMLDGAYNVDRALAYLEQNRDEMTPDARNEADRALQEPKRAREFNNWFNGAVSGFPSSPASDDADKSVGGGGATASGAPRNTPVPMQGFTDTFAGHQKRGSAGIDFKAARGTSIRPVAEGIVEEVGTGKTGGNFIRIRHPDGTQTSYMHMEQRPQYEVGDRVTQTTVIGTVGSTGRASGPHLHLEVKDAKGNQIDPEPYLKGAMPLGSPDDPRRWDRASVLRQIDQAEASGALSLEEAQDYRVRAERKFNQDEAIINEGYKRAGDAMNKWLFDNLENFTSFDQIPAEIARGFSPEQALRYKEMALKNADSLVGDYPQAKITKAFLEGIRIQSPEAFASMNLSEYAPLLGPQGFIEMESKRAAAADKGREDRAGWTPNAGITSALSRMSNMSGVKYSDADKGAILSLMEGFSLKRFQQNGQKPLNNADYEDAYRYATEETTGTQKGRLWGETQITLPRYKFSTSVEKVSERNVSVMQGRERERAKNAAITRLRQDHFIRYGTMPDATTMSRYLQLEGFDGGL
jgi:murein DD-endopeptidase MepM/ murein hydrolase activator NlpD